MSDMSWIGQLKVTPGTMTSVASRALKKAKNAKQHMCELKEKVNSSNGYWLGAGGNAYRAYFNELGVDIDEALEILEKDIEKLTIIAQTYENAEASNVSSADSLPIDVIF